MRADTFKALICAVSMGMFSLAAWAMVPKQRLSDILGPPHLAEVVPTTFGEWQVSDAGQSAVVNPQQEAQLKTIYKEMLLRTYVNAKQQIVMLSISYGDDQSDGLALHYPEVCYPAQGFTVLSQRNDSLRLPAGFLPVRRLETVLNNTRYEPVSYWMMLGERAAIEKSVRKKIEFAYAMQGAKPDGLLFRVSSIDTNSEAAFELQDKFVRDLTATLGPKNMKRLTGLSQ